MKTLIVSTALAICVSTGAMATTITDAFSSFWVLGDSLSDNGNLFEVTGIPGAPYVDGRFSNGLVWNESLLTEFTDAGQIADNFAVGGAMTTGGDVPSLQEQAFGLSTVPSALLGPNPLVSIWAGANDIRNGLLAGDTSTEAAIAAANAVQSSINLLAGAGVSDFLVFNLPNLGLTAELQGTAASPLGAFLTNAYNTTLATNLASLPDTLNIIEIDIASLFGQLVGDPMAFELENASDACILNPTTCNPDTWLFFDGIHPTAAGHALIEAEARAALNIAAVPLPASAPLLAGAVVLMGWCSRRRKIAA